MALPSLFWIFSLLLTCHAQSNQLRGQNLTISFGPDNGIECPNTEDPASLTFSTGSIPLGDICYNLDEVFSPLNTLNASGYHDYPGILWAASNAPIQYSLVNPSAYSTSTNYSRIRYSQTNATGNGEQGEGKYAALRLYVYGGRECSKLPPLAEQDAVELPIYDWTCQSAAAGGDCRTLPYAIQSFAVQNVFQNGEPEGDCREFEVLGSESDARRERVDSWLMGFGLVAAMLAGLL